MEIPPESTEPVSEVSAPSPVQTTKPRGNMGSYLLTVALTAVVVGGAMFLMRSEPQEPPPAPVIEEKMEVKDGEATEKEAKKEDAKMEHAPVPESAMGPAIDQEKGYYMEDLGEGLYWVTDGVYQVMFMATVEGVVVVDAPPSMGDKYMKAIREITEEPITHVIYSHSHADHISGASIFPADAEYIAHVDTATQLARMADPARKYPYGAFLGGKNIPLPTTTFTDDMTLEVGGRVLELSYKGPAHEPGNIFVYAPAQKVLLLIDVIFPGWSPFKELAVSEDIPAYIAAHDQVLAYDFTTLVSGHVGRRGIRADVELQREYILDMQFNSAKALETVDFNAIAAKVGFENPWLLFDTYLDAVEEECVKKTIPSWTGRLGGVDVFTDGHCGRIIESLRID